MAMEIIWTIKSSGGDYTDLAAWSAGASCDMRAAQQPRRVVFPVSSATGTITDGDGITESGSGYTATLRHFDGQHIFVDLNNAAQHFSNGGTLSFASGGSCTCDASQGDRPTAVAEIDGEITSPDTCEFSNAPPHSWVTDATSGIVIRSKGGARRASNVALNYGSAVGRFEYTGTGNAIYIGRTNVTIEDIDIKRTDYQSDGHGVFVNGAGLVAYVNRVFLQHSGSANTNRCFAVGSSAIMHLDNCIALEETSAGGFGIANGIMYARYCVAYGRRGDGFTGFHLADAYAANELHCTNCYSMGMGFYGGAYPITPETATLSLTTCASSDTRGSEGLQNLSPGDQFTSLTSGSEDFRLKEGAGLIGEATAIEGLTTDIYGYSRDASPDIGPMEYGASGGPEPEPKEITATSAIEIAPVEFETQILPAAPYDLYCADTEAGAQNGSTNPSGITNLEPWFSAMVRAPGESTITRVQIQVSAPDDDAFSEELNWDSGWITLRDPVGDGQRFESIQYGTGSGD